MPDFSVSTGYTVSKDQVVPFLNRSAVAAHRFEKTTVTAYNRATRASDEFRNVVVGGLAVSAIRSNLGAITGQLTSFITEAGRVEMAEADFIGLAGSIENSKKVVASLRAEAARTPFEFRQLAPTAKMLLGFEAATQKDLIPTLKMLGDTAGGSGDKLNRIALAYGQIQAAGKASMQDINQLVNAGIPILGAMREELGVKTIGEVRKLVSQGRATGAVVTKAFRTMTSEGGKFYRGMARASLTFEGRMSTLRDNIAMTKAEIGLQLLPIVKEYVDKGIQVAKMGVKWAIANKELIRSEFISWVQTGKDLVSAFWPILKATLVTFKAFVPVLKFFAPILPVLAAGWLANKIALGGMLALGAVSKIMLIVKAAKAATAAQWLWNIAMTANPIGLIIAGITAVVAGIVLVVHHWDFLQAKLMSGLTAIGNFSKQVFFGVFHIFTWVFGNIAKGIFFVISKIGKFLGLDVVEKEFAGLMKTMDELKATTAKEAGLINVAPQKVEISPDQYKFDGIPEVKLKTDLVAAPIPAANLQISRPRLGIDRTETPKFAGLETARRGLFDFKNDLGESGADERGIKPFTAPGVTEEIKKTITHKLLLQIPGMPEGTKVKQLGGGGFAPPIEIEGLGAN